MSGNPFTQISVAVAERVMMITLDRPERLNAWTPTMQRELCAAFDRADADDAVRAVIVTGAGRAFCAGADLDPDAEPDPSAPPREILRDTGGRFTLRVFDSRKPVIAAINGPAVGIGVTMTLPMDIRLASTEARLGLVFARRGIVTEAASSWFLPRVVGISQATGRVFDAAEGLEGGLLRSVHPPDELLPAARELAAEIADNTAPVSVALSRRLLWEMLGEPHPMSAHRADSRALQARLASADFSEGVESFLAKRPARFGDRVSEDETEPMPWRSPPEFS